MALAAALAQAATRLLRGCVGLSPAAPASAAVVPALSHCARLFCGLPTTDAEPSAPVDAEPWEEAEAKMLRDIEPVVDLVKDILHSSRYGNGGFLSPNDEKVVVEKLLCHHPFSKDKIGCGVDAIMVGKHPGFKNSRCLFVVRTNGDWEDFSYRKCIRAYLERKYPSHADRFVKKYVAGRRSQPLCRPN